MILTICIAAIVVSVVVGGRFKVNTGVIAMVFAFLIGYFLLGKRVEEIIALLPLTIIFYLVSIALFFNYAVANKTMEVLGKKLLAFLGSSRALLPWAIVLVCAVVGGLGAGASTPAIVGPFAFSMSIASGVSPVLTAVCIAFGNLIGTNNPYNGYGGVISKNLILENGTAAEETARLCGSVWFNCSIMSLLVIGVFWLIFKKRGENKEAGREAVPDFTLQQRRTVAVILLAFVLMVVPEILKNCFHAEILNVMAGICKPQVVMMAGALVCSLWRLAPEKEVIRQIPVNTILMISGVYVLIKIAVEAGLVEFISGLLAGNVPGMFVPGALVLLAAFLSFFSSSTSTVMPLMYPLVPQLAGSTGIAPVVLYTCIFFGGLSTAISPFSTGGALTIAGCPDPGVKERLVNQMMVCALVIPIFAMLAAQLGLFGLVGRG